MIKKRIIIYFSVILLVVLAMVFHFYVVYPFAYKNEIERESQTYGLDKTLVASMICAESRFNKNAQSNRGACGLMQIMPSTAEWIAGELNMTDYDLFDANTNIKFGCYYLKYLFEKYHNEDYVICCYNAGESVVQSWAPVNEFSVNSIKYDETKNYLKKIKQLKKHYVSRF